MQPVSSSLPIDPAPSAPAQPACPLCQGRLLPQRGQLRCARCCFTLCAGCEGGGPIDFAPHDE